MNNYQSYKYLIYDNIDQNIFKHLINLNETKIINFQSYKFLHYLFEIIKVFHLFLLNQKLIKIIFKDGFFIAFICAQILRFRPKIVLTATDNDIRFYKLKKHFGKNIKFLVIQNGLRSKFHDMFNNKEIFTTGLSADYYFSFGTNIREFIKKYINVEVIPIGSFKSNLIKQKSSNTVKNNKLKILYVSSFRLRNKNQIFEKRSDGKVIYWQDIFNNDMKLCKLVNNYCINTNNNFTILGTTKNNHNLEIKYFKKNLLGNKWKFLKKKNDYQNYHIIDSHDIIVVSESTLGYEALGRNKKVAFFKKNITPYDDWRFGWPASYLKKGLFYSDKISSIEVNRLLNNLIKIKSSNWKSILIKEKNRNMRYDFKNTILKKYL